MLKDLYLCRTSTSQIKGSCGHRQHHQLGKKQRAAISHDAVLPSSLCWGELQPPRRGASSRHRAGQLVFFLDGYGSLCTVQLCFGAARLCSFHCHVGEMGRSLQPGMLAGAGLGHAPAAPVMEEPSSHCDPGTKGPSAPPEVPAIMVCTEMYSPLKTERVTAHREVLLMTLLQMLELIKG